jgi:hypothetical protein
MSPPLTDPNPMEEFPMKRKLLRTGLVCCLALVAGMLGAGQVTDAPAPPSTPPTTRITDSETQINDLTLRLRLNRMEPSALTVPAGRYAIHIVNGIVPGAALDYQLRKANGKGTDLTNGPASGSGEVPVIPGSVLQGYAQVATKNAPKGTGRVRMGVTLTPGQYVLWTPGRQEWQCQITVTEKP